MAGVVQQIRSHAYDGMVLPNPVLGTPHVQAKLLSFVVHDNGTVVIGVHILLALAQLHLEEQEQKQRHLMNVNAA